jgi:hypothetical protein
MVKNSEIKGKIFRELEQKFTNNLNKCISGEQPELEETELKARAVAVLGQILGEKSDLAPHQSELVAVFDEVFADMVVSMYLSACALDKPAEIVLRRALELGIATVYLWDLPHVFWAWKDHDCDLNFNAMTEHLAKESYGTFIKSINTKHVGSEVFDCSQTKKLYRMLSNTAHGKISTLESNLPDRFSHSTIDWTQHLSTIKDVQAILQQLWEARFPESMHELKNRLSALSRYK